ncbi:MAG: segregation/condensation protein A [Candidatus Brocadiia bacterium]
MPARVDQSSSLVINIECFEGPFELLLYLVRASEVDIWAISVSEICDSYLAVLERSQAMDLEIGGEFLTIAAALLELKSRMILPGPKRPEEDALDPREELIRQIVEYRECRSQSELLRAAETAALKTFPRAAFEARQQAAPPERTYDSYVLFATWQKLLAQTYARIPRIIHIDRAAPAYYRQRLLDALTSRKATSFSSLLVSAKDHVEVVSMFLALLELVKDGLAAIQQGTTFGEIRIAILENGVA